MGKGGGKVGTRSRICQKGWAVYMRGPCFYQAMSKLITVKSMWVSYYVYVCCAITLKYTIYNEQ